MNRLGDNVVFISAREQLNIDELKMKIYDRAKEIHVARFPTTISCSSATTISTRRAGRIYSSRRYLMKYFFSAGEASGDTPCRRTDKGNSRHRSPMPASPSSAATARTAAAGGISP